MRVLHLVRKNTQLRASFIQNQILNHIDFEPIVVYRENRESLLDGGFAQDIKQHIPVYNLASDETICERWRYKIFKRLSKRQKKLLHENVTQIKPDIIHLHYGTDAGIYLRALRNYKIPKVVSFYGYECSGFPRRFLGYGATYLKNRVYKYSDKVFAMSLDMKKDLILTGCPEQNIIVHYYGTDVHRFNMQHDYFNNGTIRFLIISGLEPQKGHSFLLKSFAKAFELNKDIRLTIVGSGQLKGSIDEQVKELSLQNVVSLPGPVVYGSKDHLNQLATHDVFIHPSVTDTNGDKEGIPGAIVEAMSAGLPVISTYHAGIPYIIENGKTGLLVHENDVDSLANIIIKMAESSELRKLVGIAGQKFARNHLDLSMKEIELEQHYNNAITAKL